jgi:hypothetical protein
MESSKTSLQDWSAPYTEGFILKLPSGRTASIRPVSFSTFLRLGRIPEPLTSFVIDLVEFGKFHRATDPLTGEPQFRLKTPELHTDQDWREWFDLLDSVCETCFVEPKVRRSTVGTEWEAGDSITPDMIDLEDKYFVYGYLGEPVEKLKTFFLRSSQLVAPLSATIEHTHPSVRALELAGMAEDDLGNR